MLARFVRGGLANSATSRLSTAPAAARRLTSASSSLPVARPITFASRAPGPQPRRLGSHAPSGHHHAPGEFVPPYVDPKHVLIAEILATGVWLWLFWRAKNDLYFLLGFQYPWEAEHGDHIHETHWKTPGVGQRPVHDEDHHEEGHH